MKYGGRSPLDNRNSNDLGRFGLGLKTASLSQCKVLTVVSKQNDLISARRWDLNYVRRHGTLVFHRYLNGEEGLKPLSIAMNNAPVEPSDPFLKHRATQVEQESVFDNQIKVVPYMLPHPSRLKKADHELLGLTDDLQKYQGFYIYRNKRLIVWGTWFRRSKKELLSQLQCRPISFDKIWIK